MLFIICDNRVLSQSYQSFEVDASMATYYRLTASAITKIFTLAVGDI